MLGEHPGQRSSVPDFIRASQSASLAVRAAYLLLDTIRRDEREVAVAMADALAHDLHESLPITNVEIQLEIDKCYPTDHEVYRIGGEAYSNAHIAAIETAREVLWHVWGGASDFTYVTTPGSFTDLDAEKLLGESANADAWDTVRHVVSSHGAWHVPHSELRSRIQRERAFVVELLQGREVGPERSGDDPGDGDSTPKPVAASQSGKVKLFSEADGPEVNGKKKATLSTAGYNVVLAILNAEGKGLTKDQLDAKSGHGDSRKILKRIADGDQDWAAAIQFPGKPGCGYRIP